MLGVANIPASAAEWRGAGILNGGKGFAQTPMGQVLYRDLGPRDSKYTLLLMHQSPMSMVEFGEIQDALAALGVRSVAIDTPGYGLSDHPARFPTIADFADNVVAVLDHLKLKKVIIGGHHTGASIAASFAARHPDRTAGIILHGTPVFTPEEAAKWKQQPPFMVTELKPDGSHLSRLFRAAAEAPAGSPPPEMYGKTWMTIGMFLQGVDIGHPAAFNYDMTPDLKAIKAPGLILTDVHDVIHDLDQRAAKMRPDFKYVQLTNGDTAALMNEPKRWAAVTAEWVRSLK
jgi:pimeloyl-ACP methyl ester carboxylesterase